MSEPITRLDLDPPLDLGDGRTVLSCELTFYRVQMPNGEVQAFAAKSDATADNALDDIVTNPPAPPPPPPDPRPLGTILPLSATFHHSEISASGGITLLGVIPPGWSMIDFQCWIDEAFDATRTISVGTAATPTRWVNALAVSTTGFKQATPVQLTPQSAANGTNVFIKKSAATTVGNIVTATALIQRKF